MTECLPHGYEMIQVVAPMAYTAKDVGIFVRGTDGRQLMAMHARATEMHCEASDG